MSTHLFVRSAVLVGLVLLGAGVSPRPAEPANDNLEGVLETMVEQGWTEATVDTTRDVGEYVAVAVDPATGTPYVSYYDLAGQDLWFARRTASGGNCGPANTWSCQLVDSSGDVGTYNSIAVKSDGANVQVIISYYDATNGSLKVAQATCGGTCPFVTSTISAGNPSAFTWRGLHTSAIFDLDGLPRIAYQAVNSFGNESSSLAWPIGSEGNCGVGPQAGKWQCIPILLGEGRGLYNSIAVDALNRLRIASYDSVGNFPWYAEWVGDGGNCGPSGWDWRCFELSTANDTGASMSLIFDSNSPHMAYLDATTQELVYATYAGVGDGNCGFYNDWQCDVIDDVGPVAATRTVAMAADSAGRPIIVYRDASSTGSTVLMVAQPIAGAPPGAVPNCGPVVLFHTWYCRAFDGGSAFLDEAAAVSIASNDVGMAIAYHELSSLLQTEGNLKAMFRSVPMFEDGFESGDTGAWSATTP